MLRMKSVIILKTNPEILKCSGEIKTCGCGCCVGREDYLGFGNSQNEAETKKYCETKKILRE